MAATGQPTRDRHGFLGSLKDIVVDGRRVLHLGLFVLVLLAIQRWPDDFRDRVDAFTHSPLALRVSHAGNVAWQRGVRVTDSIENGVVNAIARVGDPSERLHSVKLQAQRFVTWLTPRFGRAPRRLPPNRKQPVTQAGPASAGA